jgi:hypothetical protein
MKTFFTNNKTLLWIIIALLVLILLYHHPAQRSKGPATRRCATLPEGVRPEFTLEELGPMMSNLYSSMARDHTAHSASYPPRPMRKKGF